MTKTWLISDTHWGHNNCYVKFTNRFTGAKTRPWAANSDEGDEYMRDMWSQMIGDKDRVYHLGDVAIPRRGLKCMEGLPGRKILLRGNHDIFKLKDYAEYFEDIQGTHKLDKFILSHYPLHDQSIPQWCPVNIHGHTHTDHVWIEPGVKKDPKYLNICVEETEGKPVDFEEIRSKFLTL